MDTNPELWSRLGTALNEADFVDLAFDPEALLATASFVAFGLDADAAADRRLEIQLVLQPVRRLAVSLRDGYFDDRDAAVLPVTPATLQAIVRSFGGMPVYGWEFFDVHDERFAPWSDRLSLDWRNGDGAEGRHSLCLFQDPHDRTLDLCIWFDDLTVLDGRGRRVSPEAFAAAGERWWRALYDGDPRTHGHGMTPLADFRAED